MGSSVSGRHEHKEENEDKQDATGDASLVHVHRGKERTQGGASSDSNVNIGSRGGSTTVTRTENTYSWNSSTVNGGPVRTWSKNTSSVTGQDGVTRFKESSSSGSGAHGSAVAGADENINKYKIYYTSTGDQQENRFGAGSSTQEANRNVGVSISDHSNIGHYNISESSQQGYNNYGQTGSEQYGATHQNVDNTRKAGSVHSYFDWDSSAPGIDISRTSSSSTFGTTHHQTGAGGSTNTGGNSGYISGSGEIVYNKPSSGSGPRTGLSGDFSHRSGSRSEDSFGTRFSGARGGEGHGTINYGTDGSRTSGARNEESHGTINYGSDGSRTSGTRHETESRSSGGRHEESHGTVTYGTDGSRTSGGRHDESHGTVNYGPENTRTSGGRHEDGHGIINYGTDHSRTSGARHEESHGIINYGTDNTRTGSGRGESSHGVINYGAGESRDRSRTDENVFRAFYTLSGKDLRGLISEEDLRSMLLSGSGEYKNGTHTIRWTTDHRGSYQVQNDTFGYRRPYSISTEESVNQGLDEYTRTVTQAGSHTPQTNRQSGGRDRSSYGQHDQTHGHSSGGIGDAALAGGFRTTALDLGSLSNTNTNSGHASATGQIESSRSNTQHYGTSSYYDPDLDSYEDRSGEANKQGSVTYGSSRTYSTGAHSSPGTGTRHDSSAGHAGSHGDQFESHSSSYSYSSGNTGTRNFVGDNVPTEFPADTDYRNRIYRNKREADDDISNIIQCKSTKCSAIRCLAGPLTKHEEAWAALRFRANAATLKEVSKFISHHT